MLRRTIWVVTLTLAGCTSALTPGGVAPTASAPAEPSPAASGWLAPETVVDEYKVADGAECPFDPDLPHEYLVSESVIKAVNAQCDEVVQIATAAVIKRHSLDSSVIGNHRVYVPYLLPGEAFSQPAYVVVFDLADGSHAAAGVSCPLERCVSWSPRDLDAPEPVDHSAPEVESSPSS
jgi:hypothetical protein